MKLLEEYPTPWKYDYTPDDGIVDADGSSIMCRLQYYPWVYLNREQMEELCNIVNEYAERKKNETNLPNNNEIKA